MQVTALNVYPVKSCAGTPLQVVALDDRGLVRDREFMVVDANRRFLTQREQPRLALIEPLRTEQSLTLSAPAMTRLTLEPSDATRHLARIWEEDVEVADQGDAVAAWLSDYLGLPARLVRMPENIIRPVAPDYATSHTDQVAFSDGFPVLLISQESLDDLNTRLTERLPMNRFRPNIVVRGAGEPYAEDGWAEIRIGEVVFSVVKACARCVTTTTDQETADRGREPLATLATYRRIARGVLFGQNLIHAFRGRIAVGDYVEVLRTSAPPGFLPSAARVG